MKIDTLQFVHTVLVHHPPEVAQAHVAALLPSLLAAVSDPFYKITSEALLVLQQMVSFLHALGEEWGAQCFNTFFLFSSRSE
jgi:cullin-associated NEDD8-dissociated protein 1